MPRLRRPPLTPISLHPQPQARSSPVRLAIIQHGDYRDALNIVASNKSEPYSGMRYSVRCLESLIARRPHLLISLNAPHYHIRRPHGQLLGLPLDSPFPHLPGKLRTAIWARRLLPRVTAFKPTHFLIRTGADDRARVILDYCLPRNIPCLALFANHFPPNVHPRLIASLNHPLVHRVGNHRHPATQSMIDAGIHPEKCAAYDWLPQDPRTPESFTCKTRKPADPIRLLFAGNLIWEKGVGDLLQALHILCRDSALTASLSLQIIGQGPAFHALRSRAKTLPPGLVTMSGRRPNREVFQAMRDATFVCVPSHHSFTEGMPQTITEAFAARTPVIASDHPIFVRTFQDGAGIGFFKQQNPAELAELIADLSRDADAYAQMSRATRASWQALQCRATMADLLDDWQRATMPNTMPIVT